MIGIASVKKYIEMIELLVKNGADPNILGDQNVPDNDIDRQWQSRSFLSMAVQSCDVKMVKLAIKPEFHTTKEMINSVERLDDVTPLMIADIVFSKPHRTSGTTQCRPPRIFGLGLLLVVSCYMYVYLVWFMTIIMFNINWDTIVTITVHVDIQTFAAVSDVSQFDL